MTRFRFTSRWVIDAPIERVYDALRDYERWPQWWPGAEAMRELEPVGPDGLGGRGRYVWRSRAGYRLRFEATATRVERPVLLEGTVRGELDGTGTWVLRRVASAAGDADSHTEACYIWDVRARRLWMRALARLLRPIFVRNHDRLMADGEAGLRTWLQEQPAAGPADAERTARS